MKTSLFKFFTSKALYILIIAIIFMFLSFGLSYFTSLKYRTDVYGYSLLFETAHNKSNLKTLNDFISEGQYDLLAKSMNVSSEVAKDIRKVEYFDLLTVKNTYFKITINCKSNKYFAEIVDGLEYFYANQPLNQAILKAEQERITELINFKEKQIADIDSILDPKNNLAYESDLFVGKNQIKNELEDEKLKLLQSKGLNFLNGAIVPNNPYFPNRTLFGLFGFVFGLLGSAIFFLLIYELKQSKDA